MGEMKCTCKFEIGDFVVLATEMVAAKTAIECGRDPNPMFPKQVGERRLQECHGGINQIHYTLVSENPNKLFPELALVSHDEYAAVLKSASGARNMMMDELSASIDLLRSRIVDLERGDS